MKRKTKTLITTLLFLHWFSFSISVTPDLTQFVDPLIGSGGHGHVFVGASVPRGMVQLGAVNISEGWDWCSGYHVSDTTVIGFAHTHLSGTGIGDKGDILFMPVTGSPKHSSKRDYLSKYDKNKEVAEAGYYKTYLERYDITAELTATERTGRHRYTYHNLEQQNPQILINLKQGIGWDAATDLFIKQINDTTIVGYRLSKGWAEDDRVYFTAQFSEPIVSLIVSADTTKGKITPNSYALITFAPAKTTNKTSAETIIEATVGISAVDIEGSTKNLDDEANGLTEVTFDMVHKDATKKWNEYLSSIEITGGSEDQLKTFYTALFHAGIFPSLFNDVDGRYRGADGKTHHSNKPVYTVFSLWDTYRAAHPLFTLTEPEKVPDMINTMLDIYDQQGKLPVWHLWGNETDCMVGFGSVQVIADAILKGIKGFDYERAYKAMRAYAELDERGLKSIREIGIIPADSQVESVAKALEYSISDWAVAAVAKELGYKKDAKLFAKRAQNYKQYFDPSDLFVKGLFEDGTRRTPFDPVYSTHREDDFCEGNSWQYSWLAPHDFKGLINLYPSKEIAEKKLDSLFNTPYVPAPNSSPDISGMIGQYAHGNEPSHSTIYAYEELGKPEKTATLARHIIDSLYFAAPNGLSGNEDCGQMSAWYILNAMGIYQPNPALGEFVITSPIFQSVTLKLPHDKTFTIERNGEGVYHKSATLNGKKFKATTITYDQIMEGGVLILNY